MDSSSDGSFAWTDASDDDTSDNETMAKTNMNTSQSGEESESGKANKKKHQKRLFSGCTEDGANNSESHQVRKRKISQRHSDNEQLENPKKRRIKTEPESDFDMRKVKKKYKYSETNSQDLDNGSYDESYLDLKLRNEQNVAVPSSDRQKKRKNKNESIVSNTTMNEGYVTESHKSPASFDNKVRHSFSTQIQFEDESISLEDDESYLDLKLKKEQNVAVTSSDRQKKRKSKNESIVSDTTMNERDVTESHKSTSFHKKVRHSSSTQIQFEDESISLEDDDSYLDLKLKKEQNVAVTSSDRQKKRKSKNESIVSDTTMNEGDVTESHKSTSFHKKVRHSSSTQIQFEDESISLEDDDSYLDIQLKNEQNVAVPSSVKQKKHKSRNESIVSDTTMNEGDVTESYKSTSFHKKVRHSSSTQIQFEDESISLEDDDSYLDIQLKNEQNVAVPSSVKQKKRKSRNESIVSDTTMNEGDGTESHKSTSFHKKVRHSSSTQIQLEDESINLEEDENKCNFNEVKKKKKKSKRKRDDSESEDSVKDSIIRDDISIEKSVVRQSMESNQKNDSPDELDNYTSSNLVNKTLTLEKSSKDHVTNVPNGNINRSQVSDHSISDEDTNQKSRISEIMKVQENNSYEKPRNIEKLIKNSSKFKAFLSSNINLIPFCDNLPFLTDDDDDVWVIRCPKDVPVEAFQGKQWTLDSKCKIKLDGQTYEGDVDNNKRNITILSTKNENTIIKKITLKGCVRLHRRLPKTYIQDSNIMINNQNNFIPLPETKFRHPLFGLHYKKAIKIPSAVADRLQAADNNASIEKRKKKNDRRKLGSKDQISSVTPKMESATETSAVLELTMASSSKKKKKRKHSNISESEPSHRHKRTEHNPESAEAWESEKAIEENLFNF